MDRPIQEVARLAGTTSRTLRHYDDVAALEQHAVRLEAERRRIDTLIRSVRSTIETSRRGGPVMADTMFEGFDHAGHREEVEHRWGRAAYAEEDAWWRSLDDDGERGSRQEGRDIADAYAAAQRSGHGPADDEVQGIARRHHAWVTTGWGGRRPGPAAFVRDAVVEFAQRNVE